MILLHELEEMNTQFYFQIFQEMALKRFMGGSKNLLTVVHLPILTFHGVFSIGFAMNDETNGNISEAIKLAEDHMYCEKLSKSQSSYRIVSKILKLLEIRDDDTANRLSHLDALTARFARKLSLSDQRTNELRLLVKFHAVCKVGTPDEILFKPDKLKKEEIRVMQRHLEIVYRILSSILQLRPVAEFILKHHEW